MCGWASTACFASQVILPLKPSGYIARLFKCYRLQWDWSWSRLVWFNQSCS